MMWLLIYLICLLLAVLSSIKTTAEIIHDIPNMIFLSKLDYFIKAIEGNL